MFDAYKIRIIDFVYDTIIGMKKRGIYFYYIIILLFCPVASVYGVSKNQEIVISDHCNAIKDDLSNLQKLDSRARVYLGRYYETILSIYMTPLNVRLVENNISNVDLIENQNKFAKYRSTFSEDFVAYQKDLEELTMIDCKLEPKVFYEKLVKVREKRKKVKQDTVELRDLISEQIVMVKKIREELHE